METFSNSLNYVQTPGSSFLTVSKRLLLVVPFPPPPSRLTLYIDPTAALWLPRKMCQTAKTLFASKRHRIRGARHEQDLISRTLSQNHSSEILPFFSLLWRGVLRHPGTKRGALITRLWKEERRSGENSYFWQPLKRDLMLEWALKIGLVSFLHLRAWVGGIILCEH